MKRVAVVGGGIFGATAAIYAARAGHEVHLFEKESDVLQAASGINQYRLHRGYHYPRSSDTARSAKEADVSFRDEYREAVIENGRHIYAIAKEGSLVAPEAFLAFCREQGLEVKEIPAEPHLVPNLVALVVEGEESWMDPAALRRVVLKKLKESGVELHLNTRATPEMLESFDTVVLATYARLNELVPPEVDVTQEYQYEVCEKPVVRLSGLENIGIVVLDGPFMCADPWGDSGLHVLGNVVHAIHATNIGRTPIIPENLAPLLDRGLIKNPPITKIQDFIASGSQYIPALGTAEHVGSLFTIRTVLPRLEKTDARPTIVTKLSDRYIRIFSGKIGNCVEAAKEVVALL
ncbi:FAD-binding oxidoreductase [Candidatus Kaiserbacteria bacterium]|nr:FAD-binding oxidoreductase [Candidatus Kaiserbacteria bacterium]